MESKMTQQKYIVLRTEKLFVPDASSLGAPRFGIAGAGSSSNAETLEVSAMSLSKADRDDMRRDPRTQAMAAPMPLKLIEPTDTGEPDAIAAAANATWGVEAVGATQSQFDGAGVKVAVLDTGIDPNHAAFNGVNLTRKNFTTGPDDDRHGHGTHCAGTIFGRDINGLRIGVARGVTEAIVGKVLGPGGGSSGELVEAIQWAVREGANVVSMSLGIDFPGFVKDLTENGLAIEPATSIALEQYRANVNLFSRLADLLVSFNAVQEATLIIAASGNESNRPHFEIAVSPPAAGTGVISVGALADGGASGHTVAGFSNTQCNISGPGVGVISAKLGGGLVSMNGTSMATPHAAGVAALWAEKQLTGSGGIRSEVLSGQLLATADRASLAPNTAREDAGEGMVQAP
jgi:subtilisin family serine protease